MSASQFEGVNKRGFCAHKNLAIRALVDRSDRRAPETWWKQNRFSWGQAQESGGGTIYVASGNQ
jgi:hypothetical protein